MVSSAKRGRLWAVFLLSCAVVINWAAAQSGVRDFATAPRLAGASTVSAESAALGDERDQPLELKIGPEPMLISLAAATVGADERWATNGYQRSVWLRWVAPADGYLLLRTRANGSPPVASIVGDEKKFPWTAAGESSDAYWSSNPISGLAVPVSEGVPYLVSVLALTSAPDSVQLEADFAALRLFVAPNAWSTVPGARIVEARLEWDGHFDSSFVTNVTWELWMESALGGVSSWSLALWPPGLDPRLTRDLAMWPAVPNGVWEVRVSLQTSTGWNWSLPPAALWLPPSNDLFANATTVSADRWPWSSGSVILTGSSAEPDEPLQPEVASTNTVWWKWKPTEPETVIGFADGFPLAVFSGDSLEQLRLRQFTYTVPVEITVRAGETLYFQVSYLSYRRSSSVKLMLAKKTPGDDFETRIRLADGATAIGSVSGLAATQPGETVVLPPLPYPVTPATRWWSWVPPDDGTLVVWNPKTIFRPGTVGQPNSRTAQILWRAWVGDILDSLQPVKEAAELDVYQRLQAGVFRARRGVPIQLQAIFLNGIGVGGSIDLEFLPDLPPGQFQRPLIMADNFSQSLFLPVAGASGESLRVETTEDLGSWRIEMQRQFSATETRWLGPFRMDSSRLYFRVIRE